ncbi:MAG: hypothetical protein H6550_04025 [Chitinophagales bacterium]|nr:hypothetical protein [Chitinophagales bacterium]
MKQTYVLLLLMLVSWLAHACECDVKPCIDSAIKNADFIISGRVLDEKVVRLLRYSGDLQLDPDSVEYAESLFKQALIAYTFKTDNVFKTKNGYSSDTIIIYSEVGAGMCGVDFIKNADYIVYATVMPIYHHGNEINIYYTDKCTRTDLYDKKEEQLLKKELHNR